MNFKWLLGAALLTLSLISGCSNVKEELKPVQLERIEAQYKLVEKWQRNTGAGQDVRYQRLQPAILDNVIYVVDIEGLVSAWNAKSGKRLWEKDLDLPVGGGIGVSEGLGFVGTLDGRVIAIDLTDGSVKWQAKASSEVVSAPQANNDVVIAQAIDGRVFAFDVKDGRLRWNYDHPMPVLSLRSNATPLVIGENAYVAFDNGQLLNFNAADGQLRWSARVGQPRGKTELERLVDVDAAPIELGPYIYGAGYNARLVAISKGTGRIAWAQDVSTFNNIAAGDDFIVVSDVNSHISAYNALDGSMLWQSKALHRRGVSAPAVLNDVVIAVDAEGYIHGLSAADGSLVARGRASGEPVLAQPLVVNNTLYLLDTDGRLSAYKLKSRQNSSSNKSAPSEPEQGPTSKQKTGVKSPK